MPSPLPEESIASVMAMADEYARIAHEYAQKVDQSSPKERVSEKLPVGCAYVPGTHRSTVHCTRND